MSSGWMAAAQAMCAACIVASLGVAQAQVPAERPKTDARSHLKAGLYDAGVAAWNIELTSETRSPQGAYDPLKPETRPKATGYEHDDDATPPKTPAPSKAPESGPKLDMAGIGIGNSDMAFARGLMVQGSFQGFSLFSLADPDHPKLISQVACPGGQGDVSIYGNLVFMSVEQNLARVDCGTAAARGKTNAERFRGVRIFDITDPASPRQVAAVQTCRGSHTNTLIPDPKDPRVLYVYNSATAPVRSGQELAGCSDGEPEQNPNTSRYSIDVIKVPLDAPEKAAVISSPRLFADPKTGAINGLWKGDNYGPGTQSLLIKTTDICHDITAYPALGVAAGACAGDGLLIDIRDPAHPRRIDAAEDPNFAFWHSATFSNDGSKVVFTDEWASGLAPRCRAKDNPDWGADVVMSLQGDKLKPLAFYKLPSDQPENSNCVAHSGGLVPVPGRDILVQAWYGGGVSVMDFTDGRRPREIAYFAHGPVSETARVVAGYWAAYWNNGRIYASEIARCLDVMRLKPSAELSANEIAAAELVREDQINVQTQGRVTWPDKPVVARAYLDQLVREKAVSPARAARLNAALDRLEKRGRKEPVLAADLERQAGSTSGRDVERLRGIARILAGGTPV